MGMRLRVFLPLLALLLGSQSAFARPQVKPGLQPDGTEVGQLWIGEKGITETVEEIMVR